ncbi:MAG: hypothetical protein JJT85_04625 [Chromatiales bacterium]|nr:hypothetical protein [Chromatiales bacterium]
MKPGYRKFLAARVELSQRDQWTQSIRIRMQEAYAEALASGEPLTDEMRQGLALAFRQLASGELPELFKPDPGPGRRMAWVSEMAIRSAVDYVRLSEEGLVHDAQPIKNVAAHFGVNERTVKTWLKKVKGMSPAGVRWLEEFNNRKALLGNMSLAAMDGTAEENAHARVEGQAVAKLATTMMQRSAEEYRAGRGDKPPSV